MAVATSDGGGGGVWSWVRKKESNTLWKFASSVMLSSAMDGWMDAWFFEKKV